MTTTYIQKPGRQWHIVKQQLGLSTLTLCCETLLSTDLTITTTQTWTNRPDYFQLCGHCLNRQARAKKKAKHQETP